MGQNSLVYRVLKAKCFPKIDFVNASLGNNPFFTWHSVMAAQHLVRKGPRWRVNNGESIRVWGEKWLPTSSTYTAISPRLFLQADTRVSELIEESTASWKTSIVDALFLSHEAQTIKSIPLSSRLPADRLVWTETLNGLFSVSSCYKLASYRRIRVRVRRVTTFVEFWRKLWHLPIPHKIRHFGWRACHEVLPTKVNLKKSESAGHILWSCSTAQEAWGHSKMARS